MLAVCKRVLMLEYCICSRKNDTVTSFQREFAGRRKHAQKKAKMVRFEDYLDDAASGYVGTLRRKFKAEDQKSRTKKEVLTTVIVKVK